MSFAAAPCAIQAPVREPMAPAVLGLRYWPAVHGLRSEPFQAQAGGRYPLKGCSAPPCRWRMPLGGLRQIFEQWLRMTTVARAIDAIPDLSADLHAAIFKAECANDLGNAG